ncbi:MAG: DMT family transporter [Candidatus Thorarchaeota archaeon]
MIEEEIVPQDSRRTRIIAVLQALFVTVLWSSSFVIIEVGLQDIPPLTFAGLRYSIASVILLTLIIVQSDMRQSVKGRPRKWWGMLFLYGCIYITATQGTQFLGLFYLDPITLSLLLNLTPIIVLLSAIPMLGEKPSMLETILVAMGIFGVLIYFYPLDFVEFSIIGLIIGVISLFANSASSIIGRAVNRSRDTPALIVTGIMMAIGSVFLMIFGIAVEPVTPLSLLSWFYILWLAVVNTALAFTLWNRAMRVLRALDMTLINSTMMPQIVILSVIFLGVGEKLVPLDWVGLILLALSVGAVQYLQAKRMNNSSKKIARVKVELDD